MATRLKEWPKPLYKEQAAEPAARKRAAGKTPKAKTAAKSEPESGEAAD
jgi:hypothetical protein